MVDLDTRLRAGPLKVKSIFSPDRAQSVARRALQRRRMVVLSTGIAGLSACIALVSIVLLRKHNGAVVVLPDVSAALVPTPIRFGDGSTAEPHGVGAEVRVEEQAADRVLVRLAGGARFQVVPNHARTFEVRSGDVVVRVLGTAFSMDQLEARTRVGVEHGRVQVTWPDGTVILTDGEVGTFPPEATRSAAARTSRVSPA